MSESNRKLMQNDACVMNLISMQYVPIPCIYIYMYIYIYLYIIGSYWPLLAMAGSDEHGQKIAQKAEEEGMTPQASCDLFVDGFKASESHLCMHV